MYLKIIKRIIIINTFIECISSLGFLLFNKFYIFIQINYRIFTKKKKK